MIGQRIKLARQASGLSLRALANKIEVSAMAISKYERDELIPSSGVILSLSKALQVRSDFFFRQVSITLNNISYREHHKLPEKEEKRVLSDINNQLEKWTELEKFKLAPWSTPFSLPLDLKNTINDLNKIEDVVISLRKHWELGMNPIPDLIDTLERKGVTVLITKNDKHKYFNGLSARLNGSPIVVVGESWSGDRQRFTLAHELGHLVLDGLLEGVNEEQACNRFAGAFLVPNKSVIDSLGVKRSSIELQELLMLKHKWGLSMQAWSYRALETSIINKNTFKALWKDTLNEWRNNCIEPGAQYEKEKTILFKSLVYQALAENMISGSKAAELLGITVALLQERREI